MTIIKKDSSYKVHRFSGGEIHITFFGKEKIKDENILIKKAIQSSDDIMEVLLVNEIVRRKGAKTVSLDMLYIPYARQDRATTDNSPRSLKVFADLLNSAKFDKVYVMDPHSYVAENLINNIEIFDNVPYIKDFMRQAGLIKDNTVFVSPDVGALKKVEKYAKELGISKIAAFHKERDPATGDIINIKMISGDTAMFFNHNLLILDDICDGGGTFIQLANAFNHSHCKLNLFVTHGIFSKGLSELKEAGYEKIGCTESFYGKDHETYESQLIRV